MSHNIENNMLAFAGATPWHGLGEQVTADRLSEIKLAHGVKTDGEAMLILAKMNWKVQRRSLAMRDGSGAGLLTDPLRGFRAIVREDTNEVFQVATDRYYPVQNAQIVEFFQQYCEAGHATLEMVGALQGGKKVWALAKLNGGSGRTLQDVDELQGYMLLATSHDGSLRTIGKPTQVRAVCWNTLSAALFTGDKTQQFECKHSRKWTEVADEARRMMGMAIERIAATNDLADKLSRVSIGEAGRIEYVTRLLGGQGLLEQVAINTDGDHNAIGAGVLEAMMETDESRRVNGTNGAANPVDALGRLGKAILEAIVDSPGSDLVTANNTMWGAVNGVTYYTDHVRGRGQDTRLASAWFGQSDMLKNQAVKVACEMAGVEMPNAKQAVRWN